MSHRRLPLALLGLALPGAARSAGAAQAAKPAAAAADPYAPLRGTSGLLSRSNKLMVDRFRPGWQGFFPGSELSRSRPRS